MTNKPLFYKERLKIILSLYEISKATKDIIKLTHELKQYEEFDGLLDYVNSSKITRFNPYCEKMLSEIREIHPDKLP